MRNTLFILLWFVCSGMIAQQTYFELQSDGSFKTSEGKSFIVVEHGDMSAPELFDMYSIAALKGYKTERRVVNEVSGKVFAIEGITDTLTLRGSGTIVEKYEYQVMLHFKDGKVRIDAPYFGVVYASMKIMGSYGILIKQDTDFTTTITSGSPFLKFEDGVLKKEKYRRNWKRINAVANGLVKSILDNIECGSDFDW